MRIDERKHLLSLTNVMFDKEARVYATDGGVYTFDSRFHDRKTKENYLDYLDSKIRQLSESNELKSVGWLMGMSKSRTRIGDHGMFL